MHLVYASIFTVTGLGLGLAQPEVAAAASEPDSIANAIKPDMNATTALVLVGLVFGIYLLRKLAAETSWLQTKQATVVLTTVTGLVPAVVQAIQSHGLNAHAISNTLLGAMIGLLAVSNPSMKVQTKSLADQAEEKASSGGRK